MNITIKELTSLFPDHNIRLSEETVIHHITHDTRNIKKGSLFIAIKGLNFDGHDFIDEAIEKGALLVLSHKKIPNKDNILFCEDTVHGMGKIAHYYRKKFKQPLIAITGSSGKTTTKEILYHVLSTVGKTCATKGNFNNAIGVPLTIFDFLEDAKFFIVEMGMSHFGEIKYLAQMADPDIALITSIGRAHCEGVGDTLQDIANAKGELFSELKKSAAAIVNNDSEYIKKLATKAHKITYGLSEDSDFRAIDVRYEDGKSHFTIKFQDQTLDTFINLVGPHHIQNALSVFTICHKLGLSTKDIKKGLESYTMDMNRGKIISYKHINLIDDSYNANPDSMKSAFESLRLQFPKHKKIAVLGGMLEIGKLSDEAHFETGENAKKNNIFSIYGFSEQSRKILEGFGYDKNEIQNHFFTDHLTLANNLLKFIGEKNEPLAILFKGSRGMKIEQVLKIVEQKLKNEENTF